jgi:hypothetical protein
MLRESSTAGCSHATSQPCKAVAILVGIVSRMCRPDECSYRSSTPGLQRLREPGRLQHFRLGHVRKLQASRQTAAGPSQAAPFVAGSPRHNHKAKVPAASALCRGKQECEVFPGSRQIRPNTRHPMLKTARPRRSGKEILATTRNMRAAAALCAMAALALCSADIASYHVPRTHSMEGASLSQSQSGMHSQVNSTLRPPVTFYRLLHCMSWPQTPGLAYVEPMALIGGQLSRGQTSALPSRTCARPLGEVHVAGRPAPSLSSLQHVANSRRTLRHDVGLRKRNPVAMDSSFDPLGLASGIAEGTLMGHCCIVD